jgi:hypothetical protein
MDRLIALDRVPPQDRACFMFDHPSLHWPTYGFLDYTVLARHAKRHNYRCNSHYSSRCLVRPFRCGAALTREQFAFVVIAHCLQSLDSNYPFAGFITVPSA